MSSEVSPRPRAPRFDAIEILTLAVGVLLVVVISSFF